MHIAYVTTGYPWVSHTFIQNEVLGLRALGVDVDTFTIARSPLSECRTDADRDALPDDLCASTTEPVALPPRSPQGHPDAAVAVPRGV